MGMTGASVARIWRGALLLCAGCGGTSPWLDGDFELLSLAVNAGFVSTPAGSPCERGSFINTRTVVAASRQLTWDVCETTDSTGDTVAHRTGQNILTEAGLANVKRAIAQIAVREVSDICIFDLPIARLELQTTDGRFKHLIGDEPACVSSPKNETLVTGLLDLSRTLDALRGQ
jgi:hypothetical protein